MAERHTVHPASINFILNGADSVAFPVRPAQVEAPRWSFSNQQLIDAKTPSEFLRVSGFWNQSEPMALDPPFLQNNTRLSQPAQPARKSQIPPTPPKLEQLDGEARTEIPYMKAEPGTTVDLGVLAIAAQAALRNDAGQSFPEQLPLDKPTESCLYCQRGPEIALVIEIIHI